MPVKNRANNETGRLRLAHRCPNCGAACVVRDSSQKSAFSREYYSQYALFLIRRWLTLPYYLYCLRLAALYEK